MIYIDTDVLIHAYVVQEQRKHDQAREVIEDIIADRGAAISTLSVQEVLHVLSHHHIRANADIVEGAYDALMRMEPIAYDIETLRRAVDIGRQVGFRNINDCIHTAIAESHCTELITYNRQDFTRIRNFARIDITIL